MGMGLSFYHNEENNKKFYSEFTPLSNEMQQDAVEPQTRQQISIGNDDFQNSFITNEGICYNLNKHNYFILL
jgi:hypothetical protein